MDEKEIEKYKDEFKNTYAVKAAANTDSGGPLGYISVAVTAYRKNAGIENALVEIFKSGTGFGKIADSDRTDISGKTKKFALPAKQKLLSESQNSGEARPYTLYDIRVSADGFLQQQNLNIPVFEGVTTIQNIDLTVLSASADGISPLIFNEMPDYNL